MYPETGEKIIDLTSQFRRRRLEFLRNWACAAALWTQYAAIGALLLYGLLRVLLCPGVPAGHYVGPLFVLWPISFCLLLASYVSDLLLWRA